MQLWFTHPRSTETVETTDDGHSTGRAVIEALVKGGFLEPTTPDRPYTLTLTRTNQQILPGQALESAGVTDGDTIAVGLDGKGAVAA